MGAHRSPRRFRIAARPASSNRLEIAAGALRRRHSERSDLTQRVNLAVRAPARLVIVCGCGHFKRPRLFALPSEIPAIAENSGSPNLRLKVRLQRIRKQRHLHAGENCIFHLQL